MAHSRRTKRPSHNGVTSEGRRVAWHTGLWDGQYSALYLKVLGDTPAERLTLVLLANSDALRWATRLDEASVERSPFATAFLAAFPASPSRTHHRLFSNFRRGG